MKGERIDITGRTFGLLKVVGYNGAGRRGVALWLCRCRCQNWRVCRGVELRAGRVSACRKCARNGMAKQARARELNKQRSAAGLTDPARILPLLTAGQRAEYDRWDAACRALQVYVSASERLQVLREIAGSVEEVKREVRAA